MCYKELLAGYKQFKNDASNSHNYNDFVRVLEIRKQAAL